MSNHWDEFHRRWARLQPPLRPNEEIVASLRAAIAGRPAAADDTVLLLGVTPELADIGPRVVAVELSAETINRVWPGNTEARQAIQGDWRALPCGERRFTAVVGDGSLACVRYADEYAVVFARLAAALRPGAVFAMRMYLTPEACESLADVRSAVLAGGDSGFHALKWRLAMAIAAEHGDPNVPVRDIHRAFDAAFPDRARLAAVTGWTLDDIAEIDAYAHSDAVYSFPTPTQLLDSVPETFTDAHFVTSGTYRLADRCPILVMRRC